MAFLLILKTFFSKVFSKIIEFVLKYPVYAIIFLLCFVLGYYYSANNEKKQEIANLNTEITKLKSEAKTAKDTINEQNKSVLRYKNLSDELDAKLTEALNDKKVIDDVVQDQIRHDAPVESDKAFDWLYERAGDLKKWAD